MITRTQVVHTENAAASATIAQAATVSAGALVVVLATGDIDTLPTGVADDLSVAASVAGPDYENLQTAQHARMFIFAAHAGGARTFTVTYNASATRRGIVVLEYANVHPTVPQWGAGTGVDGGETLGSADAGLVSPPVNGCLIVGYCVAAASVAAASPMTDVLTGALSDSFFSVAEYIQTTAAPFHPSWTTSDQWAAGAAVFGPPTNLGTETSAARIVRVRGIP